MSVLQQIKQEGIQEGIEQGIQKGIQKGRLEILDLKEKEQFNKNIDMIKMMQLEKIKPHLIARFLKVEIKFVEDVIANKVKKLKIES